MIHSTLTPEVSNMQRVVSKYRASKFNIFLAAGRGAMDVRPLYPWSRNLQGTRNFSFELMRSSTPGTLIRHVRLGNSLAELRGKGLLHSAVSGGRPVATRRVLKRNRNIIGHKSGYRSSRIQSAKDITPQRLLDCAVDVLREFNQMVTDWRQRWGGDKGLQQFSTAAEKKEVSNVDSVLEERGTPKLTEEATDNSEGQGAKEFEWRISLWEAELSSAEEIEVRAENVEPGLFKVAATSRVPENGISRLGSDGLLSVAGDTEHAINAETFTSEIATAATITSPEAETLESNKTTQKKDLAPPVEVDIGDLWNRSSRGQVLEDVAEPVLASESRTRMPFDTTDTLSTEIIDRNRGQAQEEAKLERSLVSEVQTAPAPERTDAHTNGQDSGEGSEPSRTIAALRMSVSRVENEVPETTAPALEKVKEGSNAQGSAEQTQTRATPDFQQAASADESLAPETGQHIPPETEETFENSHEEAVFGRNAVIDSESQPPDIDRQSGKSIEEAEHRDLHQNIDRLRRSVGHHAYLYHTLDSPVISDAAFDGLVQELNTLKSQTADLEPSHELGAEPSPKMEKYIHSVPMLSLASVQKEADVFSWHNRLKQKLPAASPLQWVVEPKVDGLALSLRYEFGKLKVAATRGDGTQGEVVTHNALRVAGIPQDIPHNVPCFGNVKMLEVRGEIFMSLRQFEEWNASKIQSGLKPMSNPRNAAAGSMRLLSSPSAHELRPLNFIAYSIASVEVSEKLSSDAAGDTLQKPTSQWEALILLKSLGFSVNKDNQLCDSFESAVQYAERWRETRRALDYEADGVVVKVNDLATQATLGSTGGHPRWAIAWKFAATEALSVLEGIELTVGRSGVIIPNARFKPVEIGGAVVSRASLHNFGHVKTLGLCEGDHIVVQRAGDVIPQICQVLKELRPETAVPWVPPQECPSCGSSLTEATGGAMVFCSNPTCGSRTFRQAAHFAKTLIPGIGSGTLTQLEDEQLVHGPADFYDMDELVLAKVKGFGKLSISKLLKAIEDSKQQDLWLFITALGIPKVGTNTAKELAKAFGGLPELMMADVKRLQAVRGVGAATAAGIFEWCHGESNIELVRRLAAAGCKVGNGSGFQANVDVDTVNDSPVSYSDDAKGPGYQNTDGSVASSDDEGKENVGEPLVSTEGKAQDNKEDVEKSFATAEFAKTPRSPKLATSSLSGKTIVITGELENGTRKEMEELIRALGGTVRGTVSSRTSILLCGRRPGSVKLSAAARFGIETMDWETFEKRFPAKP